jgi:alkaline phosphatase
MVDKTEHFKENLPHGEIDSDAPPLATSVIFMIPDGFGDVAAEAYGIFKGSDPVWESGFQSFVHTHSASSEVTDSAAAATAFATGVKTNNGSVGVDENGAPLVSILELAYNAGKATGIVSTDVMAGATPAAFAASNIDRDNRDELAQDYIDRDQLTVMLGGGRENFLADPDGDGATTLQEAQAAGFEYVTTADELRAAAGERLLGLFGYGPLGLPIGDRSDEPTLAEMTEAALDRLETDEDGFFLFVEASGTDTWAHANDAAAVMRSAQEYEDALQVALAYAAENPGTLIVSVADHETGGMQLALDGERTPAVFQTFEATYAEMLVEVLNGLADVGFQLSTRPYIRSVQETISDLTGGSVQLTRSEILPLLGSSSLEDAYFDFSEILNARGGVEYTTTSHTGADVSLFAFGPGAGLLPDRVDNTEIAPWLASAMGLSFPAEQAIAGESPLLDTGTVAGLIEIDLLM